MAECEKFVEVVWRSIVPDMTDPSAPSHQTREGPRGTRFREIRTFEVIDSTNRYLRDAALAGENDGLVAIARHQSEGKGRHGRKWDSKPGSSLLLSVLLRTREVATAQKMTMAMALAVTDAAKFEVGVNLKLKWPNDVIVEDPAAANGYLKVAGVLGELVTQNDEVIGAVTGAGINLNWGGTMPDAFKASAASLDDFTTSSINENRFTETLLRSLNERVARPAWLVQSFRSRCATIGQSVRVIRGEDQLMGTAIDVDETGALVVETEKGVRHTVTAGEITHLRPHSS